MRFGGVGGGVDKECVTLGFYYEQPKPEKLVSVPHISPRPPADVQSPAIFVYQLPSVICRQLFQGTIVSTCASSQQGPQQEPAIAKSVQPKRY